MDTRSGFVSLQNVHNRRVVGAWPRTPLGELTALPKPFSWVWRRSPPQ